MVAFTVGSVALADESVHLAAINIGDGISDTVRAAAVDIGGVVVRADARAPRVGYACGWNPAAHRNAVHSRVGAEVAVERPVLLRDDDHMLDLVDTLQRRVHH